MGKKILLADDSITIQKVIELTFSDEDFEVVTVGNGRLAVEKAQEVRPDIVLCDIIMPEKDGYEVCDFVKRHPALSHVPVLLLTGAFEPFDQERATRVGCDGYLAKPFEPQTLIAKVKDLLNQAGARRAVPAPAPASAARPTAPPAFMSPPPSFAPPAFPEEPSPDAAFIPEEPVVEETSFGDAMELEPEPAHSSDVGYGSEPEPSYEHDAGLLNVTPEESETLSAAPEEATEDFPSPSAPWSQPTVEVPLETRAQARSAFRPRAEPAVFEEMFDDASSAPTHEPEPPVPPARRASAPSRFPAPPAPEPEAMDLPEPMTPPAEVSFAGIRAAEPAPPAPAAASSQAAELAVPVDMVEKIAQRVVAQISEKVVREIAWEVIPDLAEALIKKEIERLKAELQQLP